MDECHKHVNSTADAKMMMAHFMEMKLISLSAHSVFVGQGYFQNACASWSGTESIRYYMYLIRHGHRLLDAVAFTYGYLFRKAGDPVLPIYSVFELPRTPQVQLPGASGSQDSKRGHVGFEKSGKSTGTGQSAEDIPPHCRVEDKSPEPSDDEQLYSRYSI